MITLIVAAAVAAQPRLRPTRTAKWPEWRPGSMTSMKKDCCKDCCKDMAKHQGHDADRHPAQ